MGWVLESEDRTEHEGYAAYVVVTPWGERVLSGTSSATGVVVSRRDAEERARAAWDAGRAPTTEDLDHVVPWRELQGWQAACACGWTGEAWTLDQVTTAPTGYAGLDEQHYVDSDGALLSDGRTVEEAAYAAWCDHVGPMRRQVQRVAAIKSAADAYWQARHELDEAVYAGRADPALSWAEIGAAAGVARQSAHERWGRRPQRDGS